MSITAINPGAEFIVPYPFQRYVASVMDHEGLSRFDSWKPGPYSKEINMYTGDEIHAADGAGSMVLTVVSTHKPGKYQARVFYTRLWIDPDGKTFGKGSLRMATESKFMRISSKYRFTWSVAKRRREEWAKR